MSGTVRSVDFDADSNRSVLHVEAVTPSPRMRNAIRSFVYNIREDDDRPDGDDISRGTASRKGAE